MAAGDAEDIVKAALRISRKDPTRATDVTQGLYWLNECHRSILTDATPWEFLEVEIKATAPAGEADFLLSSLATAPGSIVPDGIDRILSVADDTDGGPPLRAMHWRQLERIAADTEGDPSGRPVFYTQIGLGTAAAKIKLWPTPAQDTVLGLLVRLAVVDLVAADFPLIPAAHASAVLTSYIASRMWNQQAGPQAASEAAMHMAAFERARQRLVDAYGSAREENILFAEPYDDGRGYW